MFLRRLGAAAAIIFVVPFVGVPAGIFYLVGPEWYRTWIHRALDTGKFKYATRHERRALAAVLRGSKLSRAERKEWHGQLNAKLAARWLASGFSTKPEAYRGCAQEFIDRYTRTVLPGPRL